MDYTDHWKNEALKNIDHFVPNMLGTNFLGPLKEAINMSSGGQNIKKRIFLLTDGEANYKSDEVPVIECCREQSENSRIFPIGLGDACSQSFIDEIGEAGRGISTIVRDKDAGSVLSEKIVMALEKALM